MAENDIVIYKGYNKVKVNPNAVYNITAVEGREVQLLVDSDPNATYQYIFNGDGKLQNYYVPEYNDFLNSGMSFQNNKKSVFVVPKSYTKGSMNLLGVLSGNGDLNFPFNGFIDPYTNDPLKILMFSPRDYGRCYYNPANMPLIYNQSSFGEDDILIMQEISGNYGMNQGVVNVDKLPDSSVDKIVKFMFPYRATKVSLEGGKEIIENRQLLKDFGFNGKFYFKKYKGKNYIIFKGNKGLKKHFKGTRYATTNPKIVKLTLGETGKVGKNILKSAKIPGFTIIVEGCVDCVEWLMSEKENKEVSDLLITFGMDLVKSALAGVIAAGVIATILFFIGATAPVWVVVGGVILVGIGVGLLLDWLDEKFGVTEYLQNKTSEAKKFLGDKYDEFVIHPLADLLYQFDCWAKSQMMIPSGF